MAMSNLSARIGAQALFSTNISRARGPRVLRGLSLLLGLLVVGSGCEAGQDPPSGSPAVTAADASPASMRQEESRMWMTVGERRFAVTLTDNAAARAFAAQLPLTLDMSERHWRHKRATDFDDAKYIRLESAPIVVGRDREDVIGLAEQ